MMTNPARHPAVPAPSVRLPFAALVLAMLPAVLDQTILATALPTIATDLGRLERRLVARDRLRRGRHGVDPALGQARGPPRPQAAAAGRPGRVRRRLGALRRRRGPHPARRPAAGPRGWPRAASWRWPWPPWATSSPRASAAATRATSRRRSPAPPSSARSSAACSSSTSPGAGSSTSTSRSACRARRARRPAARARAGAARPPPRPRRGGPAGRGDLRPAARVRLGRRPLRVGLGRPSWPSSARRPSSAPPSSRASAGRRTRSCRWRCCARPPSASRPPGSSWPPRRSSRSSCSCPSFCRRRPARPRPRPGSCSSP